MKKIKCNTLVVLILSALLFNVSFGQSLPDRKGILKILDLTNQYFMNKWPDAGKEIVTNQSRPSNIWTRAVYYEGLMALYSVNPQKKYYEYATQWGNAHAWNLRGGVKTRNADNQACGQTYIALYEKDRKLEQLSNIKASIDSMLATSKIDDWNWIDAIQMSMPVFAKLGVLFNDTAYFKRMHDMYSFTKYQQGVHGLYNEKEHLWWRDKDFVPPYKEPNGENCYWSRGNGWVVAALVRVLNTIPKNELHRSEYLADYRNMMQALLPLQRIDGYWNVSLKDSTHFGGKELTGTSLFIYGMAWGINNGYLDKKVYLPVIIKAWNAMVKDCVHEDGVLGFVQGTGKEPKDSQPVSYTKIPDFEDFGLGCFLLAGSELYKIKK